MPRKVSTVEHGLNYTDNTRWFEAKCSICKRTKNFRIDEITFHRHTFRNDLIEERARLAILAVCLCVHRSLPIGRSRMSEMTKRNLCRRSDDAKG